MQSENVQDRIRKQAQRKRRRIFGRGGETRSGWLHRLFFVGRSFYRCCAGNERLSFFICGGSIVCAAAHVWSSGRSTLYHVGRGTVPGTLFVQQLLGLSDVCPCIFMKEVEQERRKGRHGCRGNASNKGTAIQGNQRAPSKIASSILVAESP